MNSARAAPFTRNRSAFHDLQPGPNHAVVRPSVLDVRCYSCIFTRRRSPMTAFPDHAVLANFGFSPFQSSSAPAASRREYGFLRSSVLKLDVVGYASLIFSCFAPLSRSPSFGPTASAFYQTAADYPRLLLVSNETCLLSLFHHFLTFSSLLCDFPLTPLLLIKSLCTPCMCITAFRTKKAGRRGTEFLPRLILRSTVLRHHNVSTPFGHPTL